MLHLRCSRNRAASSVCLLALVVSCAAPESSRWPAEKVSPAGWWKGNLHTHSLWSDGDEFPEMVVDWYRTRGYDFLAISDHNTLHEGEGWLDADTPELRAAFDRYRDRFGDDRVAVSPADDRLRVRLMSLDEYRGLFEEPGRFLLLSAAEITTTFESWPLHVNATNLVERVDPQSGSTVVEVLQRTVDAVLEQRGRTGQPMFPHVNHPNYGWGVTAEDIAAIQGEKFFEVFNGHPQANNDGDGQRPSTDRMWDIALTDRLDRGQELLYGLAVDDAHVYQQTGSESANPGRGWIMVQAGELTAAALIEALERGDFYASTGVLLDEVVVGAAPGSDGQEASGVQRLELHIRTTPGVSYRTQFIGTRVGHSDRRLPQDRQMAQTGEIGEAEVSFGAASVQYVYGDDIGEVLDEVEGPNPSYELRGDELYVRAKVVSSAPADSSPIDPGSPESEPRTVRFQAAWTQPILVASSPPR